jgi:antitoxin (DNA-binding transcriptional repressor) of toxin-antitoxin stability system
VLAASCPLLAVVRIVVGLAPREHTRTKARRAERSTGLPEPNVPYRPFNSRATFVASELFRRLDEILGKVHSRGDSFVVERNGDPVARIVPLPEKASVSSLREALVAWRAAGPPDPAFADDLERVGAADRPAENAWA